METPPENGSSLADTSKRLLWRLVAICHNRSELFMVEIQEERERARVMIFFAAAAAVLGLLAGMTLTAIVAIAAGRHYFIALVILAVLYVSGAVGLYLKLGQLRRDWESFPGTRDQLQKDRECFENHLT
jgi:uncharacterized membrane protein YqjE